MRGSGEELHNCKVAKYKEVMRLSPTEQFISFLMEANGLRQRSAETSDCFSVRDCAHEEPIS
jgi:hypothetical protein